MSSKKDKFSALRQHTKAVADHLKHYEFCGTEFRLLPIEPEKLVIQSLQLHLKEIASEDDYQTLLKIVVASRMLDMDGVVYCTTTDDYRQMVALLTTMEKEYENLLELLGVNEYIGWLQAKADAKQPKTEPLEVAVKNSKPSSRKK